MTWLFASPTIGKLLHMSPEAFGAWAGTWILNSAQVAGAALAFQPDSIEARKVAEIFNITPVLSLPLIAVMHTPRIIGWFQDWIVRLFAFCLAGLGMQITMASLKQAGGEALIIGGIVGTIKAVGSLIVIILFAGLLGLSAL